MAQVRHPRGGALAAVLILAAAGQPLLANGNGLPETVAIPAGSVVIGSSRVERAAAYRLDQAAYGHARTRDWLWYENEPRRQKKATGRYRITKTPITNAQYAAFVAATGHPAPDVSREEWQRRRVVHPYQRTRRHAWQKGKPPEGRDEHPVVLVSHDDARAYAAWLSEETGETWRLPSEREWEKAVRGSEGNRFPWGDDWDPERLNSHDAGPFDTLPVGSFPEGASPFGVLDGAGQVFEWTASESDLGHYVVKGGSWDDSGCGICRPAARHDRPAELKHILIGFRLVLE